MGVTPGPDTSPSLLDAVPAGLSALARAHAVAARVAEVGFDWPDLDGVLAKVDEERDEVHAALAAGDRAHAGRELGDLLLACVNLGRFLGVPAEEALAAANARFEARFAEVERRAAAAGVRMEDAGLERLEGWWQDAKRCEASRQP